MNRLHALLRHGLARRRTAARGQVFVIFAGGLVILLLATGLVIDGGMAFLNRREAQNIADLAALAGTKVVADHYTDGGRSGGDVYGAIAGSVSGNGCIAGGSTSCTWSAEYVQPTNGGGETPVGAVVNGGPVPAGAQGVKVTVTRLPGTFFLRVIGQDSWEVITAATGMTWSPAALPEGGVLPIAIDPPNQFFQAGQVYNLTAGMDGPGNFSWLSWDGTNDAPSLARSICDPDNPEITFPTWVDGDPGKSNSHLVRDCLQTWLTNGATVLIPTWDRARGQGNDFDFRITGLAAVTIEGFNQPAIDTLTARFVRYYPLPSIEAGWRGPPGPGGGTVLLGLIR